MGDHLFQAWLKEQRRQQTVDIFDEGTLRALYDRYPGRSIDELTLEAMRKTPEKFDALGVTIDGQKPSDYFRDTRFH